MKHRIAAGALVVEEGRLLMVNQLKPGVFDFWVPPGGGVLGSEELSACAVREVEEETGLRIETGALAYIEELVSATTRQCKFWYLARVVGGKLLHPSAHKPEEFIASARFLDRRELLGKTVFPAVVVSELWADLQRGIASPRYLGVRSMETYDS